MIHINSLSKSYGRLPALREIQLIMEKGFVYGLVGPNGCGKTTLIKCILSLVHFERGAIEVDGVSTYEHCSYRKKIAYLPQSPDFPSHMTLKELLQLLEEMRGSEASRKEDMLSLFDVHSVLNRPFGSLSGGMKQRVSAVCALSFDCPIVILDEPTVGIDPLILVPFKQLIKEEARQGKLVLLVSHVLSEMAQLADRMIFLLDGRVTLEGEIRRILLDLDAQDLEQAIVKWMEKK